MLYIGVSIKQNFLVNYFRQLTPYREKQPISVNLSIVTPSHLLSKLLLGASSVQEIDHAIHYIVLRVMNQRLCDFIFRLSQLEASISLANSDPAEWSSFSFSKMPFPKPQILSHFTQSEKIPNINLLDFLTCPYCFLSLC